MRECALPLNHHPQNFYNNPASSPHPPLSILCNKTIASHHQQPPIQKTENRNRRHCVYTAWCVLVHKAPFAFFEQQQRWSVQRVGTNAYVQWTCAGMVVLWWIWRKWECPVHPEGAYKNITRTHWTIWRARLHLLAQQLASSEVESGWHSSGERNNVEQRTRVECAVRTNAWIRVMYTEPLSLSIMMPPTTPHCSPKFLSSPYSAFSLYMYIYVHFGRWIHLYIYI